MRARADDKTPLEGGGWPWRRWALLVLGIVLAGCSTDATDSPFVAPDRQGKVTGRIYSLANGREVQGAFVSLEAGRGSLQTLSNEAGEFVFSSVTAGSYRLAAEAGGFKTATQTVNLAARVHLALDVGLRPSVDAGDLTGLVVDAVTGAALGSAVLSIPGKGITTFTDLSGRFTARAIDAGTVTVEVRAVGHAPYSALVTIPANGAALETFRLVPNAGSVSGTVLGTSPVRASRALGGALVKLLEPVSPAVRGRSISFQAQSTRPFSLAETGIVTRTGADGRYRLDAVTAGPIGLLFSFDSHDELLATTTVLLGRASTLDASLRFNRATVRGLVTDTNGQPVAGAVLSVAEQGLTTRTNANGRYELSELVIVKDFPRLVFINGFPVALPARQTPIGAQAAGFSPNSALVTLVAGGSVTLDFVLGRSTGTLAGQVRKARDGTAVPGSVVSLPQLGLTTPVNFNGDFSFANLPAAQLAVTVNSQGFLPATSFVVILPGQGSFVRVALTAPGALTGTVRKKTGNAPIASARVTLPELARQVLTDSAGLYTFAELPAATLRVEVTAQDSSPLTTSAVIRDGQLTRLDVTLEP